MSRSKSSQEFVPIKDIRQGVVILKNDQMRKVLLASSINFALKSYDEQHAILRQFQAFLNTIDFSVQFYVQSRRLNIQPYLDLLAAREDKQDNDLMRIQLREYMEFVRTFVSEVDIMAKNFFVVVPYSPSTVNLEQNFTKLLGGSRKKKKTKEDTFVEHRTQLEQRVSLVEQGLNRIGVRTVALNDEELIELYYHIFNPDELTRNAPQA